MNILSSREKDYLIERLQKGEPLPEDFKYKLFPTTQKEYELVYAGKMRKEDILSDEDGVTAAPLQIERIYNGERESYPDGWKNMIVFGDNLQFLKTIYKNEDPLIKDKVKGKVKLIYIDPPFATESDFSGSEGQKAYTDKAKDAEFVEFIRRRLIVAHELLANDGSIFVHLDWKKCHYVKIVLDEIFGEKNFLNEIVWYYNDKFATGGKALDKNHDIIYRYRKTKEFIGNEVRIPKEKTTRRALRKKVDGKTIDVIDESGKKIYVEYNDKVIDDVWQIGRTVSKKESLGYPTQKKEKLIERILLYGSNPNDLVFDFFGGSGTLAAVAEKLGRKWITCDIGKFAFYTIQKRILTIQDSKSFENRADNYGRNSTSFQTINTGFYDIEKLFSLKHKDYQDFVLNLFEVSPKQKRIAGIEFQGERKDGYDVLIWKYWEHKDAAVDEDYLQILHKNIGKKVGDRIYIIAPANSVQFIDDYYEIGNVRYYFLKVPYQIIQELHKEKFKKFRQPTSSSNVNSLENAVGFHFIRQPEVKSSFAKGTIIIEDFKAYYPDEDTLEDIPGLEALAMVVVDKDYNGNEFLMSDVFFAADIINRDGRAQVELENYGPKVSAVYIDIYGNEFREVFAAKSTNA